MNFFNKNKTLYMINLHGERKRTSTAFRLVRVTWFCSSYVIIMVLISIWYFLMNVQVTNLFFILTIFQLLKSTGVTGNIIQFIKQSPIGWPIFMMKWHTLQFTGLEFLCTSLTPLSPFAIILLAYMLLLRLSIISG